MCAKYMLKNMGLQTDILRSANVYGEGQLLYRIIPKTIISILKKQTFNLHGGGTSMRSFIHIDDVSKAILHLSNLNQQGDIYHLAGPQIISVRELVEKICNYMDYDIHKLVTITPEVIGRDIVYKLNDDKLKKLSWQCDILLDDGLKNVIKWIKDNWDILQYCPTEYNHQP